MLVGGRRAWRRLWQLNIRRHSSGAVTQAYLSRVAEGAIQEDAAQLVACEHLDRVHSEVAAFVGRRAVHLERFEALRKAEEASKNERKNQGWLLSLLSGSSGGAEYNSEAMDTEMKALQAEAPRGLYLHGGPGSGKTYCMDLCFGLFPVKKKRRVHFHEFMLQVHRMLHSLQQKGFQSDEMMDRCVDALYEEGWVLCFDEFQVTDIADAMIIRRLFHALLARGMVVIATSNRAPEELYKNGIQRDLFLPFIKDLRERFDVVNVQSESDYRMIALKSSDASKREDQGFDFQNSKTFFVSKSGALGDLAEYERIFEKLCGGRGEVIQDIKLNVQGRKIHVPLAARNDDVARFSFDDLCGKPMGSADYLAIASSFHTVFIDSVPQMKLNMINQVRRFINMIDTFYDQQMLLFMHARAPMEHMLDRGSVQSEEDVEKMVEQIQEVDLIGDAAYVPSRSNIDEVFAFDRTLSRLHEMQSSNYFKQARAKLKERRQSPVRFFSEMEHSNLTKSDIERMWERYDLNSDGVIDEEELREMLKDITLFQSGHKHVPEEVFQEVLDRIRHGSTTNEIQKENFESYFLRHGVEL